MANLEAEWYQIWFEFGEYAADVMRGRLALASVDDLAAEADVDDGDLRFLIAEELERRSERSAP